MSKRKFEHRLMPLIISFLAGALMVLGIYAGRYTPDGKPAGFLSVFIAIIMFWVSADSAAKEPDWEDLSTRTAKQNLELLSIIEAQKKTITEYEEGRGL